MSQNTFAYRRMTRALEIPVVLVPTAENALAIPEGFIKPEYTSFYVVNPNLCWVTLRGTSKTMMGPVPTEPLLANADGNDWLWKPHFEGAYSTQRPYFMSAMAIAMPGFPIPDELVPLRMHYGVGI